MIKISRNEYNRIMKTMKPYVVTGGKVHSNISLKFINLRFDNGNVYAEGCDSIKHVITKVNLSKSLIDELEPFESFLMPLTPILKKADEGIVEISRCDDTTIIKTVTGQQSYNVPSTEYKDFRNLHEGDKVLIKTMHIKNLIEALQGLSIDEDYVKIIFGDLREETFTPIRLVTGGTKAIVLPVRSKV